MTMNMIYFSPGDRVIIRQDLPVKPVMVVKEVKKTKFRVSVNDSKNDLVEKATLIGIVCFWFSDNYKYQEAQFSTKDLVHYEE